MPWSSWWKPEAAGSEIMGTMQKQSPTWLDHTAVAAGLDCAWCILVKLPDHWSVQLIISDVVHENCWQRVSWARPTLKTSRLRRSMLLRSEAEVAVLDTAAAHWRRWQLIAKGDYLVQEISTELHIAWVHTWAKDFTHNS